MEEIAALGLWAGGVGLIVGVVLARVLWWVLADFVLASFDLPFRERSAHGRARASLEEVPTADDPDAPEAA